jgi:biopolymer transport protein TolQ
MGTPIFTMIVHSGIAAKAVLLILLIFSLVTWAIIFNRFVFLRRTAGLNKKFRNFYDKQKRLIDLERTDKAFLDAPMARIGEIGAAEYRRILTDGQSHTGMKDWSFFLQSQFAMATEHIESAFGSIVSTFDRGVFLLAMVSSISPFLGLLGTVWGIMNSFFEIGNQGSASLPVVAPGIAEALVATLAGLAVAIPALFCYNYFNHRAERLETELDQFRELLLVRLKREILENLYAERSPRGSV